MPPGFSTALALGLLALAPLAHAQGEAVPAQPEEVVVGVFINQVHELSLKENNFVVDFYVWFRWQNPELKPYETFEVMDGRVEEKGEPVTKVLPDGSHHAYLRLVARVTRFWDISDFPLDNHTLPLVIEEQDREAHLVRYVPDVENSGVSPNIILPGFNVARSKTEAGTAVYRSNFGDISLPTGKESRYARLTLDLSVTRAGTMYFWKIFFGLWISAAIAFLVFFIKPTDLDPRFGLGVGAIFAAIASEYIVTSALPDSNLITLADKLHVVAFGFIFLSIAQSTWSLHQFTVGNEARSQRADRAARWLLPGVYVAVNALVIAFR